MYEVTLLNAGLLLTAYLVYRVAARIVRNRQFKHFAKDNGCEEPFDATGPWPYTGKLMRMMYVSGSPCSVDFLVMDKNLAQAW